MGGPSLPGKSTPLRRRRGASPAPRVDTGVTTVVEKLRESVLFNGARARPIGAQLAGRAPLILQEI